MFLEFKPPPLGSEVAELTNRSPPLPKNKVEAFNSGSITVQTFLHPDIFYISYQFLDLFC